MKRRLFTLAPVIACLAAAVSLMAQKPAAPASTQEKLYISLESTDDLAVVDLKTFKQIKTLKVGMHPHGQASPASQDKLYVAAEIGGTVTLIDTVRDEVIKTFDVGFGVEPQNGAITPDGRFLYHRRSRLLAVFDTQKEQVIEYIPRSASATHSDGARWTFRVSAADWSEGRGILRGRPSGSRERTRKK